MSTSLASESVDLAVLAQALQDVLASAGLPIDQMPSRRQLTRARRPDLIRQIRQAGGFAVVAERLGLARPHAKRPPGYWEDFANLDAAMQSFLTSAGTPGIMPTANELVAAGHGVLNGVIRSYGGFAAVAVRLGLIQPSRKKPTGYWQDFTHVASAIQAWIAAHGTPGMMPTWTELEATEDHALLNAIQQHGGMLQVATRLGLHLTYTRKPHGYWDDPANLDRDLQAWIAAHGTPGMMPTMEALAAAHRADLSGAIQKQGGRVQVAERLGLARAHAKRPSRYWADFQNVAAELQRVIATYGVAGQMPSRQRLEAAGQAALANALTRHGGARAVAARLGLTLEDTQKSPGYWLVFANLETELRALMHALGVLDRLPTFAEFRAAGRQDLIHAIRRHGGIDQVAQRLGLVRVELSRPGSAVAPKVAQLARVLQPLAHAGLLRSGHVLILLRRIGLLSSRDTRVVRLREALVGGHPVQLAAAVDDLVAAGAAVFAPDRDGVTAPTSADDELSLPEGSEGAGEAPPLGLTARESEVLTGLTQLATFQLPLDAVLQDMTCTILWDAFYPRLTAWFTALGLAQAVQEEDVAALFRAVPRPSADPGGFLATVLTTFTQRVTAAVNLAAGLPQRGWRGPRLRLHQAEAVRQMVAIFQEETAPSYLINADDPGMGKTLALLAAVLVADLPTVVVVAPKTVADDTWLREIVRCLPAATVTRGLPATLAAAPPAGLTIAVLHYDELLNAELVAALAARPVACLCLDELHTVKRRAGDEQSLRRQAIAHLRGAAHSAIGLTGTPLINELAEPLSLVQLLSADAPEFAYTRLHQCLEDVALVFEALVPHLLRRSKATMAAHVPACVVEPIAVPLAPALAAQIIAIHAWPKARATETLIALRKLATQAKLPYLRERAHQGHKLLILTALTDDVSQAIARDLDAAVPGQVAHIDGTTPRAERAALLDSFRAPAGVRILVGTIGTIGMGLTLFDPDHPETTSEIIMADLPYTWAAFEQGLARLHREGQQRQVRVAVLQTTLDAQCGDGTSYETLDQRLWELITGKRDLAAMVIDGYYPDPHTVGMTQRALHRWLDQVRAAGLVPPPSG